MEERVEHNIEPIFDANSEVLILGTMPSSRSREEGFYYAHPQNRFWRVIAEVFTQEKPITGEEKKAFLLNNHIALWDVLKTCNIKGADDSSIRNPKVNEINMILSYTNVKTIFTTGTKATTLYKKYCYTDTKIEATYLPSTSAANCAKYTYDDLLTAYKRILKHVSI